MTPPAPPAGRSVLALPRPPSYRTLIGTGGIGSGMFLELEGEATLGRNESRAARLRDFRDFCKLHIVLHYVAALLGPPFRVVPVGGVGKDGTGREMKAMMARTGMDVAHVREVGGAPTLYSVCFLYPGGDGGNLTISGSASARVAPGWMDRLRPTMEEHRGAGIALAAPEVPLPARLRLLELAGEYGFFRAAAVTAGETAEAKRLGLFAHADLVSLNAEEAGALAGVRPGEPLRAVLDGTAAALGGVQVAVTAGPEGSWGFDGSAWAHEPAIRTEPVNTAGAGDAFLAGLLVGKVAGLSFPGDAQALASLLASAKVSSADTIHLGLDARALDELAATSGMAARRPRLGELLARRAPPAGPAVR